MNKWYDELLSEIDILRKKIKSVVASTAAEIPTITPTLESGTAVATVTVNEIEATVYAPTPTSVSVSQTLTSGAEVGSVTVDDVTTTLYAPTPTKIAEDVKVIAIGGAKDDETNVNIDDVVLEVGKVYILGLLLQDTPENVNAITLSSDYADTIVKKGITVDANHCGVMFAFEALGTAISLLDFPTLAAGKHGYVVFETSYTSDQLSNDVNDYDYKAYKDGQSGFEDDLFNKDVVIGFCVDGANYDHSILELTNQSQQAFNAYLTTSIKAVCNSDPADKCKYTYMKLTQSYAQGAFVGFNLVRG